MAQKLPVSNSKYESCGCAKREIVWATFSKHSLLCMQKLKGRMLDKLLQLKLYKDGSLQR